MDEGCGARYGAVTKGFVMLDSCSECWDLDGGGMAREIQGRLHAVRGESQRSLGDIIGVGIHRE